MSAVVTVADFVLVRALGVTVADFEKNQGKYHKDYSGMLGVRIELTTSGLPVKDGHTKV